MVSHPLPPPLFFFRSMLFDVEMIKLSMFSKSCFDAIVSRNIPHTLSLHIY